MKHYPRAFWRSDRSSRQHPHQVAFVQSTLQSPTILTTARVSLSPFTLRCYTNMIPYPQSVSYAARSAPPSYSEQRKFESTYSIYPVIPPSFSLLTSAILPFGFCTSLSCQGNIIALIVAGLPLSTTAPLFQRIDPEALRLGPITIYGECLRTIFERSHHCLS